MISGLEPALLRKLLVDCDQVAQPRNTITETFIIWRMIALIDVWFIVIIKAIVPVGGTKP